MTLLNYKMKKTEEWFFLKMTLRFTTQSATKNKRNKMLENAVRLDIPFKPLKIFGRERKE